MVRRVIGFGIVLVVAPTIGWTQVVVEGLDEPEEEQNAPAAIDGATNGATDATTNGATNNEVANRSTATNLATTGAPPAFEIDRLDASSEEPGDEDADLEPVSVGEAQEIISTAFRQRLTECLGATPRPEEHGMAGTTAVIVAGTTAKITTSTFSYDTTIHLTAEELAESEPEDRERKSKEGEAAMTQCLAEVSAELGGPAPAPAFQFAWEAVWFNDAALLRDVEWK